jgi:hypothetical protein
MYWTKYNTEGVGEREGEGTEAEGALCLYKIFTFEETRLESSITTAILCNSEMKCDSWICGSRADECGLLGCDAMNFAEK